MSTKKEENHIEPNPYDPYPQDPYSISVVGRTLTCVRCKKEMLKCLFGLRRCSQPEAFRHSRICHFCIDNIHSMETRAEMDAEMDKYLYDLPEHLSLYRKQQRGAMVAINHLESQRPKECLCCGRYKGQKHKFNLVMGECLLTDDREPNYHRYRWCNLCIKCMDMIMWKATDRDYDHHVVELFQDVESGLDPHRHDIYCGPAMTGIIRDYLPANITTYSDLRTK